MKEYIPIIIGGFLVFLLLDFYFLRSWTKYIKNQGFNPFFYRIFWFISAGLLILFFYISFTRDFSDQPNQFTRTAFIIAAIWFVPKMIIVPIIFFKDLIKFIFKKLKGKNRAAPLQNKEKAITFDESKRKLLQNAAWGLAGIPFLVIGKELVYRSTNFKVFYEEIPIFNLPAGLNGFKIVQISDIHAGSFFKKESFAEVRMMINMLDADLIVITGDFVNFNPNELIPIIPEIKRFSATYGVYGCLGNHDHYMSEENHVKFLELVKDAGVKMLINENRTIKVKDSELQIIGVDNIGLGQFLGDIDLAVEGIDFNLPSILLLHDPSYWEEKIISKYPIDLTLSGHTHGGQLGFNMLGVELSLAMFFYKRWAGLHKVKEHYIYINRGLGTTGPPVRAGINPEITLLTLKAVDNVA